MPNRSARPFAKIKLWDCLACMGDSMIWRPSFATSWPAYVGAARNYGIVQNAGVDGEEAAQLAARFDRDILAWRPAAIAIMTGTNDAFEETNLASFESSVREMVNKGLASGATVTLCTPPLCRADARPLGDYCDLLSTIAGDTSGVILFDVFTWSSGLSSGTLDTYFEADETHWNAIGNQAIRDHANEAGNLAAFRAV